MVTFFLSIFLVIKKLENVYRNFWMLVSIFVTLEHKLDEIL